MARAARFLLLPVVWALACAPAAPLPPLAPPASGAPSPSEAEPAPPAPADDLAAKIDLIFAAYAKPGSPGCAAGVYRAGEVVFARGYGLANLEHDLPIGPDTVFDVGSVSKQFTAAAVILLAQEGKLSLGDDVRKYVPELPDYGRPIQLHHLLHHTSGLRDYAVLLTIGGFDEGDVTNDDDAVFAISRQKALNFPPGSAWSYSNTGYFLLSLVVKRASGMRLSAFAKQRIFDPLGMTSTMILDDHTRLVPHRATAYAPRKEGGFGISMSNFEQTGDGAVQTTLHDLARWDANFYEPRVGGRAFLDALRTPGKLDDGKQLTYAGGLVETTKGGLRREEHDGAWAGYRASIVRFPRERLTVACLCNVASSDPGALADAVAGAILPRLASTAAPTPAVASAGSLPALPPASPAPADLSPLVGAYLNEETFELRTLSKDGDALVLGFALDAGGPHRPLEAESAGVFVVKGTTTRYAFEPAGGAKPAQLVRTSADDKPSTYVRIDPVGPAPAAAIDYAGRYTSDEVLHDLQITVVDGKLHTSSWGRTPEATALTPLARDVFAIGGGGIRFDRDKRGRVRGFVVNTGRVRGLRFTRR
jgi:CubicO group peptidase (beta-lactamase class C family)